MAEAHLSIFIDGQQAAIPASIGVDSGGLLSQVHTVADDGTLHIEPIAGEPLEQLTLADFFETWRTNAGLAGNNPVARFGEGEILGHTIHDHYRLQMFVNSQPDRGFDQYVIQDGDQIAILYTSCEVVSLNTNQGSMLVELYEDATPMTVDNFLNYVNDGDYVNTFFHRSADLTTGEDFVIQTGGFTTPYTHFYSTNYFLDVPTDPAVQNEPGISNSEGTVAMAKVDGDPNSATSQFFINMRNNGAEPAYLDTQNGGFTVFGRVPDMTLAHEIAALTAEDLDGSGGTLYDDVPLTADSQLVVIFPDHAKEF